MKDSSKQYTVPSVFYGVRGLVGFQNHPRDIEPESASIVVCRSVGAVESLEEMGQVFFINVRACIDDGELCRMIYMGELYVDTAVFRRVGDCVSDHISKRFF